MTSILWFRNDLRLADHPALAEAAADGEPVVPLFVVDPALTQRAGSPRQVFLERCVEALRESTDGALVVRRGDPAKIVPAVVADCDAAAVHVTGSTTPAGVARDDRVRASLGSTPLVETGTPYAIDPATIFNQAGDPYKVFTPFFKAWKSFPRGAVTDEVAVEWAAAESEPFSPADGPDDLAELPAAGEQAALARFEQFLATDAGSYDEQRNRPDLDATSRLSPYLHFGCIHPRQILARLGRSKSHEVFRSEIAWREFYGDVLFHRPETAWSGLNPDMAAMQVDEGADADASFARWQEGTTGFPIVDAGMRQLIGEGWMHNRVRMIVASFLVKDLHLDWTRGARHFLDLLVDGDVASNNHGWQWVAGTGTDAAPYFRVFNPTTQGKRFDPDGDYVRRWVPELTHVAARFVHEPAEDPAGLPLGYVPPMVDHADEREEALRRYADVKG